MCVQSWCILIGVCDLCGVVITNGHLLHILSSRKSSIAAPESLETILARLHAKQWNIMSLVHSNLSPFMEPPLRLHRTLEESAAARKVQPTSQRYKERNNFRNTMYGAVIAPPAATLQEAPMVIASRAAGRKRKPNRKGNWIQKKNKAAALHPVGGLEDGEFRPPRLKDLWKSNSINARRYFPERPKLPKRPGNLGVMPDAPFNTTSYIMSSSKLGGASTTPLLSPAIPQPRTIPSTPRVSSATAQLATEGVQDLHVNPYGSMASLFHLRSPSEESADSDDPVNKDDGSDSESGSTTSGDSSGGCGARGQETNGVAMEEVLAEEDGRGSAFEERLPLADGANSHHAAGDHYLRTRMDEQEICLAQLEEENLDLREVSHLHMRLIHA